jgi:hypothetical protein
VVQPTERTVVLCWVGFQVATSMGQPTSVESGRGMVVDTMHARLVGSRWPRRLRQPSMSVGPVGPVVGLSRRSASVSRLSVWATRVGPARLRGAPVFGH